MPVKARAGGQGRVRGGRIGAQQGTGGTPSPPTQDPSIGIASGASTASGVGGTGGAGSIADWFVDSVAGSDSNNGTSSSTPFASLATLQTALTANPTLKRISLKGGSTWREALSVGDGFTISVYGTGACTIDGTNIFTAWTPHATAANVYQTSVTHNSGSNTNRLTAYCDGVLLKRVADVATCSSTAGSFVDAKASDGSTLTFYIHTPTTTNPASDGHAYEVTVRDIGLAAGSGTITGPIKTQRVISNNGSFTASGTMSQELCVWGTKHNALFVGALTDAISYAADPATSYELSNAAFVAFVPTSSGDTYAFTRVGSIQPNGIGNGGAAFLSHTGDGTLFASGSVEQCWVVGNLFSNVPDQSSMSVTQTGCYCAAISSGWGSAETVQCQANITALIDSDQSGATGFTDAIITDSVAYFEERTAVSNNNPAFRLTGPATIAQCVIACGAGGYMGVIADGGGTGSFVANKTIMWRGGLHFDVPTGMTYTGDFNVFMADNVFNAGNRVVNRYHGTYALTLSDWQTATGQDANSVYLSLTDQTSGNALAFWLGVSSGANNGPVDGDFRINTGARAYKADGTAMTGTFANGTTSLATAGAQNHWNWNTRATTSGPPTVWPNVPKTLSDATTYVVNPVGWTF